MRVVFVIPYFYPAWQYGGSPRAAFEYAKALVQRGHSITVLTTDSMGAERYSVAEGEPIQIGGIEVYYYRNISNALAFQQRLFWPPRLFKDLALRIKDADVIHIHELRSSLSVAACHAAVSAGIPFVVSPHGGLRRVGKAIPKAIYDRFWGKRILSAAAAVVGLSDVEKNDRLFNIASDRLASLSNSVSAEFQSTHPVKGAFRNRWQIGDRRIIAFLGRLHWIKGADILIRAFADLIRVNDDSLQLIIGGPDDGEEAKLRKLATDLGCSGRITFTGYMEYDAKAELFVDAELLVIPSRSEAFPVTLLEALMCELPVLLSDSCDLIKTFRPEHGVDSFKSEDAADLSRKMQSILKSGLLRNRVGNGRELVEREYSTERVGAVLESLYSSIMKRHT